MTINEHEHGQGRSPHRPGDEDAGDEDVGDEDAGDEDAGDEDVGDEDAGDEDAGGVLAGRHMRVRRLLCTNKATGVTSLSSHVVLTRTITLNLITETQLMIWKGE